MRLFQPGRWWKRSAPRFTSSYLEDLQEKVRAMGNRVNTEVIAMLTAWLMLSTLLYSLQLNTGPFPKPLPEEEERVYLERAK